MSEDQNQVPFGKRVTKTLKVKNQMGLHMRPATEIAKLLQGREEKVNLTYMGQSVNARSVMNILMLAIPKNGEVTLEVEGPHAEALLQELESGFKQRFGEKH